MSIKCQQPGCKGSYIFDEGEHTCSLCGRHPVNPISVNVPDKVVNKPVLPAVKSTEEGPKQIPKSTVDTGILSSLPPVPVKPVKNTWLIAKYYSENWIKIQADIVLLGLNPALNRWDIHPAYWPLLKVRLETQAAAPKVAEVKNSDAVDPDAKKNNVAELRNAKRIIREEKSKQPVIYPKPSLPEFPVFSDRWAPEVQAAWLSIYPDVVQVLC